MKNIQSPTQAQISNRKAYHHLVHTLSTSLPPPVENTPEALSRRNHTAIAQVAALCPATIAEMGLAANHVAANAYAMDCLRLANYPAEILDKRLQCGNQAASMMRQAQSALRGLLKMQAVREKCDSNPALAAAAAESERITIEVMEEVPPPDPALAPPPPAPPPAPRPVTLPASRSGSLPLWAERWVRGEALTDAEVAKLTDAELAASIAYAEVMAKKEVEQAAQNSKL